MRLIVGRVAGLTPVNFGPPVGDHALLAGTTADAGRSPKLPPDQADEFAKHRRLPRKPAEDASREPSN